MELLEGVENFKYTPGHWWRVLAPDGSMECETSNESEARSMMRPTDRLQRLYILQYSKWIEVDDEC